MDKTPPGGLKKLPFIADLNVCDPPETVSVLIGQVGAQFPLLGEGYN